MSTHATAAGEPHTSENITHAHEKQLPGNYTQHATASQEHTQSTSCWGITLTEATASQNQVTHMKIQQLLGTTQMQATAPEELHAHMQ